MVEGPVLGLRLALAVVVLDSVYLVYPLAVLLVVGRLVVLVGLVLVALAVGLLDRLVGGFPQARFDVGQFEEIRVLEFACLGWGFGSFLF